MLLRDLDVGSKGIFLSTLEFFGGSEEVQSGLPYRHYAWHGGELVNDRQCLIQLARLMQKWCLIRVNGHGGQHSGLAVSKRCRPSRCLDISSHLNDTHHPYRSCPVEVLGVIHRVIPVGEFQVSVIVIDPHLQRVGSWWVGDLAVTGLEISARSNVRGEVARSCAHGI